MNNTPTLTAPLWTLGTRPSLERARPRSAPAASLHAAVERSLRSEEGGPGLAARLERYLPFLRAEYQEHFARGGLYTSALEARPELSPRLAKLEARQAAILSGLEELIPRLRQESYQDTSPLRERVARRLADLRRAEEELLFEASYRDLGGEG